MQKNVIWLSLLWLSVALVAASCAAQEQSETESAVAPTPEAEAKLTIPQLLTSAEQYRVAKRYGDAIDVLGQVLRRHQANLEARRLLGDIYWEISDVEKARKNWLLARAAAPSDFGANFGLGRLYLTSSIHRQAAHYLETAASVAPPDRALEVLILLARARRGAGDRGGAFEATQQALQIDPESFEAVELLTGLLTQIAEGEEDLDRALTEAKRLVQIAGSTLETEGITLEGVQRLQAAYGAELSVLGAYSVVCFERNPDGRLSDRLLPGKELLAANSLSQSVDILLRQTDLQRTLAYFQIVTLAEKAVEFDGGSNPRTLTDLGSLLVATGRLEEAAQMFRRALEFDQDNETARRQLEALQPQQAAPAAAPAPTP